MFFGTLIIQTHNNAKHPANYGKGYVVYSLNPN